MRLRDTAGRRRRFRGYASFYGLRTQIPRRFTLAGGALLTALIATAVMGVDTNVSVAYQTFSLLAALVLAGMAGCWFGRVSFRGSRQLPRYGSAGQPFSYRVVLRNLTRRRAEGLTCFDNFDPSLPSYEEFLQAAVPDDCENNFVDRFYGFDRWKWLVAQRDQGWIKDRPVPPLPPQGEAEVRLEFTPRRRGVLHFTGLSLGCPDPFGLFRSVMTVPHPQSVLILPKRYPLPDIPLPGAMQYQQGGVALAASVGESEEFVSLRDYRPGDPMRHIHWRSWARTGRPIVKEFQEEFFVRHALVLDTFGDRPFSPVFEEAVSVAASFAATVDTQDTLLDLMFVGTQAYCFTAGRGLAHTEQMLEILAAVEVCCTRPFGTLADLVLEHLATLSGCICVLLAWDEARQDFVRRLDALGIPLLVLVVTEAGAGKLDPGPLRGDVRFHQLELGRIGEQLARMRA
jgi:uncharacterized protein (DUF58 family)